MELTVKLDLEGLKNLEKACEKLSKPVKVGIFDPEEAEIARLQHFGGEGVFGAGLFEGKTVAIPPRPFISIAMETYGKDIFKDVDIDKPDEVQRSIGERGVMAVQATILKYAANEIEPAHNSRRTIARKGKDSPLIDTGKMYSSVTYEVEK